MHERRLALFWIYNFALTRRAGFFSSVVLHFVCLVFISDVIAHSTFSETAVCVRKQVLALFREIYVDGATFIIVPGKGRQEEF